MKRAVAAVALAGALAFALPAPSPAQQPGPPGAGQATQGTRPSAGQVEGTVSGVDAGARTVTVNGQTYEVGKKVDLGKVKAGDHVRLGLKMSKRGKVRVHALEVLPPAKAK
jgi:hypothetical protein